MNAKHPATTEQQPAAPSKSDADLLAELCALLDARVTDAPKPVLREHVPGLVGQLLDATARLTQGLAVTNAEVERVRSYCDTLHGFIKQGGLRP